MGSRMFKIGHVTHVLFLWASAGVKGCLDERTDLTCSLWVIRGAFPEELCWARSPEWVVWPRANLP